VVPDCIFVWDSSNFKGIHHSPLTIHDSNYSNATLQINELVISIDASACIKCPGIFNRQRQTDR
jgi:hypothetical protein